MLNRIAPATLLILATFTLAGHSPAIANDDDGFKPIFDGTTLNGWDGNPTYWRVEDGTITGQTTADKPLEQNTFLIWRQGDVDDFELMLEYRIESGNSGIQYRSFEKPKRWGKWVAGGYQGDIETGDTYSGAMYGERFRGILAMRGEKTVIGNNHKKKVIGSVGDPNELGQKIRKDQWNTFHVIAQGHHFVHRINGTVMADITDEDIKKRRRSGVLGLQLHKGDPMKVQFRNIRLKRLPMKDKKKIVLATSMSDPKDTQTANTRSAQIAKELNKNTTDIYAVAYPAGWPADPTAFDNADAIVLFSNGPAGQTFLSNLNELKPSMQKQTQLIVLHNTRDILHENASKYLFQWIGSPAEATPTSGTKRTCCQKKQVKKCTRTTND